jgi:hypothetical protein
VSTDPSSNPWPVDLSVLNRLTATAVAYWSAMLFVAGVLIFVWFARGPNHPIYGLMVATWTFGLGPGVAIPVLLRLPSRCHRVPAGERVLHRMLGVEAFGWLLKRSGYNRHFVHRQWGFSVNRAGLPFRVQAAQGGASAHGACFAIHIVLAAVALLTAHPWGALWILLPGVAVHLYPVLLQRSIMLRLQPLLNNSGAAERSP